MSKKIIQKHFPADTSMEKLTFLNNPKVDAELYAILLAFSKGVDGETRVYRSDLPSQSKIAEMLTPPGKEKPVTRQTVAQHIKNLTDEDCGLLQLSNDKKYYILTKKEKIYFAIPLNTVRFFVDSVKEGVIKTYIYLGQRWKYKPGYEFTIKEICQHIGINYNYNSVTVTNWLITLKKLGFISYVNTSNDDGTFSRYKLTNFSTECPSE